MSLLKTRGEIENYIYLLLKTNCNTPLSSTRAPELHLQSNAEHSAWALRQGRAAQRWAATPGGFGQDLFSQAKIKRLFKARAGREVPACCAARCQPSAATGAGASCLTQTIPFSPPREEESKHHLQRRVSVSWGRTRLVRHQLICSSTQGLIKGLKHRPGHPA